MPDQHDNLPYPKAHGIFSLTSSSSPPAHSRSPDPISGDGLPITMKASTASREPRSGLNNTFNMVSDAHQRAAGSAPRKRMPSKTATHPGQVGEKRVRLTYEDAIIPEEEATIVRKAKYQKIRDEVARLQRRCTEKHKDLEAAQAITQSLRIVNQDSQLTITSLEGKVAELEQGSDRRGQGAWPGSGWFRGSSQSQDPVRAYKLRIQELEKEINTYRNDMARKEMESTVARNDFTRQMAQKDNDLAKARDEFTRELREARTLSNRINFKVSDNEIKGKWQELTFKVRQFVSCHYSLCTNLPGEILERWKPYCPHPTVFLSHPLLVPSLFEANLWCGLKQIIFCSSSMSWAGDPGKAYSSICSTIQEAAAVNSAFLKEYHDWRSRSVDFINRLSPLDQARLNTIINEMASFLIWDLPKASREVTNRELSDIIEDAAELDLIFRKSKAEYKVYLPDAKQRLEERLRFDKTKMDSRDFCGMNGKPTTLDTQFVDLVVSPMLKKRGGADGDKYDLEMIMVKAGVVCGVADSLSESVDDGSPPHQSTQVGIKQEHRGEDVIELSVKSEPMDTIMVDASRSKVGAHGSCQDGGPKKREV